MRKKVALMSTVLVFAFAWAVVAQDICTENPVATLKQQLLDIESRETQLRLRLEELDEELKPGRIERAVAGIGSTRPEELREHRRKMLTIERNGLQAQLDLLEESRACVESAITSAENASYLKYEQPTPTPACPQPGLMTDDRTAKYSCCAWIVGKNRFRSRDLKLCDLRISARNWKTDYVRGS